TDRAWAIARADGSVEVGEIPPNWASRVPVLRVLVGLGGALSLAVSRGMLRRGSAGAGVAGSRRLNARFLWAVLAVEVVTAFLARSVSGPRPLMVVAPLVVALVLLRLTTPSALWRYHG